MISHQIHPPPSLWLLLGGGEGLRCGVREIDGPDDGCCFFIVCKTAAFLLTGGLAAVFLSEGREAPPRIVVKTFWLLLVEIDFGVLPEAPKR